MQCMHFRVNPELPAWLNGRVFIYELSVCGFKSHCSHLVFNALWYCLSGYLYYFSPTCSAHLSFCSTGLSTRSTCLFTGSTHLLTCSTCLSIRLSTHISCLSTRSICQSTRSTHLTIRLSTHSTRSAIFRSFHD